MDVSLGVSRAAPTSTTATSAAKHPPHPANHAARDVVLGLSVAPGIIRWILVDGESGEGEQIDRGALDANSLYAGYLGDVLAQRAHLRVRRVAVTGTPAVAEPVADALRAQGLGGVVTVTVEDAARALARGVADLSRHRDVVVVDVEPDVAVVAQITDGNAAVVPLTRAPAEEDARELAAEVLAAVRVDGGWPDAVFVVGSHGVDALLTTLDVLCDSPVFSAAESDIAMARGAALASSSVLAGSLRHRIRSRAGALEVLVGAAAVVLVVSSAIALGLREVPSAPAAPQHANAAALATPAARAVPDPRRPAAPPRAVTAEPAAVPAAPVPAESPVLEQSPAPAAVPEEPAALPEPAPAVAPIQADPPAAAPAQSLPPEVAPAEVAPVPAQPRLRDRILERIPIIGRLHESGR